MKTAWNWLGSFLNFSRLIFGVWVMATSFFVTAEDQSTYFIGHLSPDTDAIMAAIVAAELFGGIPVKAGPVNRESAFALKRFGLKEPELLQDATGKRFILVDFNQRSQGIDGLSEDNIFGIIDHHALSSGAFHFSKPIDILIRKIGSTCTVLFDLFQQGHKPISEALAGAMLSAILSDTLNLESPTTTDADRRAVAALAPLAGIADVQELFMQMIAAKSDLSGYTLAEIIRLDFKAFTDPRYYGIAVVETVHQEDILSKANDIVLELAAFKAQKDLQYLFCSIVDPIALRSKTIVTGDAEAEVLKALGYQEISFRVFDTLDIISRKEQMKPAIDKILNSQL